MAKLNKFTRVVNKQDGSEVRITSVSGVGRLTAKPELVTRNTANGEKFVINNGVSIAVDTGKDKTVFLQLSAWEKTAEALAKYCDKGQEIYFFGKHEDRPYEKDGEKRTSERVTVESFGFTYGSRKKGESGEAPSAEGAPSDDFAFYQELEDDDDVPF